MNRISAEKYLVNELAQPPFNFELTVTSFANLSSSELIQLLLLIMKEIEPELQPLDLSYEDEQTVLLRTLEFLRVIKYTSSDELNEARDGILNGDPEFLVPVMAWLLAKKDTLKIRAYLAKFLVAISLPEDAEWIHDQDMIELYTKYEHLVNQFKTTHKEFTALKSTENNTAPLIADIENIQHDKDCLQSKLDAMKYRMIEYEQNQDTSMFETVRALRLAKVKCQELANQESNEESLYFEMEDRKTEIHELYMEESKNNLRIRTLGTCEEFLNKLVDETEKLRYLVKMKSPLEHDLLTRKILALQAVEENPPENREDIQYLTNKSLQIVDEIRELQNRKHQKNSCQELFLLRKNGEALRTKKLQLQTELEPIQARISSLTMQIAAKIQQMSIRNQKIAQRAEKLEIYIEIAEEKMDMCEQMRNELQALRKEIGILSATRFIIDGQWRESEDELKEVEIELGISGFYENPNLMSEFNLSSSSYSSSEHEEKKDHLYEIATNAKELVEKIRIKKRNLEPLVNAVSEERKLEAVMDMDYETAKRNFEATKTSYEGGNVDLKLKIDTKRKQWETNQFKLVQLKCLLGQLHVTKFHVKEEVVSQSLSFHGFRNKLQLKIASQERTKASLEKEKNELTEVVPYSENQKKLWQDIIKLLDWKRNMVDQGLNKLSSTENTELIEYDHDDNESDSELNSIISI